MKYFLFTSLFLIIGFQSIAQPTNADCSTAFEILDPIDYCSDNAEFNNINAGNNNGLDASTCFNNANNDVWFRFTAFAKAVSVTVTGNAGGQMAGGTLVQPEVAIYEDDGCSTFSEIQCSSDTGNDGASSVSKGGLTIGQSYLIRVDGRGNSQGTFTMCIKNFNPPVMPGQDCITGAVLCDKSTFIVDAISGGGNDDQELRGIPCEMNENGSESNLTESDATWFKWTCETTGSLSFILDPLVPGDDIDWALFELPNGIDNCTGKIHLRCAFNSPTNQAGNEDCTDLTGMNPTSTDTAEDFNCESNEDGFVQGITMEAGKSYALGINNFTPSGIGFEISFGGTGTFQGPISSFTIDPLEGLSCDTDFTVTDMSTFANGNIVSWEWNFGERALPPTGTGAGPFQVNYESFGDKFISLTVESDRGCIVTEILRLYAEPCCDQIFDIEIDIVDVQDLLCATIPDGSIEVDGSGGSPEYEFAIDGSSFNQNNFFGNLDVGSYQINIQDIKGCTDSIDVNITAPPPIVVNAGPDVTVDLCSETPLSGSYTPEGFNDMISWSAVDTMDNGSISCIDCLDPTVIAPGQTTYILTVEDEVGCSASDDMTVFVVEDYPIYGPNVFTPNGDGIHDLYTIYSGPEAVIIQEFYIYDRWGNLVFSREDMPLNDPTVGWDGRLNRKELGSQVLSWFAKIEFCDSTGPTDTKNYSGHITLIRG